MTNFFLIYVLLNIIIEIFGVFDDYLNKEEAIEVFGYISDGGVFK